MHCYIHLGRPPITFSGTFGSCARCLHLQMQDGSTRHAHLRRLCAGKRKCNCISHPLHLCPAQAASTCQVARDLWLHAERMPLPLRNFCCVLVAKVGATQRLCVNACQGLQGAESRGMCVLKAVPRGPCLPPGKGKDWLWALKSLAIERLITAICAGLPSQRLAGVLDPGCQLLQLPAAERGSGHGFALCKA